jgi:hypothetical protein
MEKHELVIFGTLFYRAIANVSPRNLRMSTSR